MELSKNKRYSKKCGRYIPCIGSMAWVDKYMQCGDYWLLEYKLSKSLIIVIL